MMGIMSEAERSGRFRSFTANESGELGVTRQGNSMEVSGQDGVLLLLSVSEAGPGLQISVTERSADDADGMLYAVMAALECIVSDSPNAAVIELEGTGWAAIADALTQNGLAVASESSLDVMPEMFWQAATDLWLPQRHRAYAQQHIMSGTRRHPRRAPKPAGLVYSRYIPWLDQVFSFRTVDIDADLERFNRWMNDPRIAYFFEEEGDLAKHRAYLERIAADPHMTTLLGCLDGAPFCYFEVYWAQENRLGPYYDARDYDRGWHVVVGEDGYRGRDYVATWLPSLMHYIFLDDSRTQRIVGEPRADHHQQIRNLNRSGFASIKEFDFPHKRAMLVMLLRERYFSERLWIPRSTSADRHAQANGNRYTAAGRSTATMDATGGVA